MATDASVVEAGTDSTGRYLYNRDLAERRAAVLEGWLGARGVQARIVGVHGELSSYVEDLRSSDEALRRARVGFCRLPEPVRDGRTGGGLDRGVSCVRLSGATGWVLEVTCGRPRCGT